MGTHKLGAGSGTAARPGSCLGFFYFYYYFSPSFCEKKQGEKKKKFLSFSFVLSQPLPSSVLTRPACTHPDGNLGREFSILGVFLPPSGRNPRVGIASVHVEFAGVKMRILCCSCSWLSPCHDLCIKQGAVTSGGDQAWNHLGCARCGRGLL